MHFITIQQREGTVREEYGNNWKSEAAAWPTLEYAYDGIHDGIVVPAAESACDCARWVNAASRSVNTN